MEKMFNIILQSWRYLLCLITVLVILVILTGVVFWPIYLCVQRKGYNPVCAQIHFRGSIYKSNQVEPGLGAFTILRPWEEVKTWGEESILSYENTGWVFKCIAWTPNKDLPGTFLKSNWEFYPPKKWDILTSTTIIFDKQTKKIKIIPNKAASNRNTIEVGVFLIFAVSLLFFLHLKKPFFGALKIVLNPSLTRRSIF